jgi:large subunit ribosomal protein L17
MKHKMGYSRLNRDSAQRKALLRGLSTQLIMTGRIETTVTRAKSLRSVVEKLVTLARTDSVAGRRLASARLYGPDAVKRLFAVVATANKERQGGYTRILKLGFRPGDNARRAIIEFVDASLIGETSKEISIKE